MSAHSFTSIHFTGTAAAEALTLPLGPGLTYVTGACGSFKTAIFHCARKALGVPPPKLDELRAEYEGRVAAALGGGTVTVNVVTAQGVAYSSSVTHGSLPIVRGAEGDERPGVTLDGELFSCQFFGPQEIDGIARSKDALLDLLDRFAGPELKRVEAEIVQAERRFLKSTTELRTLSVQLLEDAERTAELPQIEEALRGLTRDVGPDAEIVKRAHQENTLRGRERTSLQDLSSKLSAGRTALGKAAKEALAGIAGAIDAPLAEGAHGEIFRRAHAAAHRAAVAIAEAAQEVDTALAAASGEVGEGSAALAALHAKENEAYTALLAKQAGPEQAAARADVQRRFDELSLLQKQRLARKEAFDAKAAEGRKLFEEHAALLARHWSIRAGNKQKINAGLANIVGADIRVDIKHGKDTRLWRSRLEKALTGTRVGPELVRAIAEAISPAELAAAARADDPVPIMRVDPMMTNKRDRAKKILKHLRESGHLEELEITRVGDRATVRMRTRGQERPSSKLSHGQRCICILVLLLLDARGPIVIDEPESSLDRNYINTVLVPALRALKRTAQIILVSHHPSLIVLSEPDYVFGMSGESQQAAIERSGTLDEMRDVIEGIDGGRDAFLLRARLYGHKVGG